MMGPRPTAAYCGRAIGRIRPRQGLGVAVDDAASSTLQEGRVGHRLWALLVSRRESHQLARQDRLHSPSGTLGKPGSRSQHPITARLAHTDAPEPPNPIKAAAASEADEAADEPLSTSKLRQMLRNHPWKGPQHLASILPMHLPRVDADPCPMNLDNAVTFLNRWGRLGGGLSPELSLILRRLNFLLDKEASKANPSFIANGLATGLISLARLIDREGTWGGRGGARKGREEGLRELWALVDKMVAQCHAAGYAGLDPQSLAGLVNCLGKLSVATAEGGKAWSKDPGALRPPGLLQEIVRRGVGRFNDMALTTLLSGFARVDWSPGPELLNAVAKEMMSRGLGNFTSQSLVMTLNAFARLNHNPGVTFLDVAATSAVDKGLYRFSSQGLSLMLNAYARLQASPGLPLLQAMTKEALRRGLTEFAPQGLANLLNGFARLEHHPGHELLDAVAKECLRRGLSGFSEQGLVNVLNGYARLNYHPGKELLSAVEMEANRRGLGKFSTQGLSLLINGFAKLQHRVGERLLSAAGSAGQQEGGKEEFSEQAIDNLLEKPGAWRYAAPPPGAEEGAKRWTEELKRRGLSGFTTQGLANLLNGFARLRQHPGFATLDAMAAECVRRGLHGFTAQALSMLANAYARLDHHPGEAFLEALATECESRQFDNFRAQELSTLINALANLGYQPHPRFMKGFLTQCRKLGYGNELGLQNCCQLLWSFEVLGVPVLEASLVRSVTGLLSTWRQAAAKDPSLLKEGDEEEQTITVKGVTSEVLQKLVEQATRAGAEGVEEEEGQGGKHDVRKTSGAMMVRHCMAVRQVMFSRQLVRGDRVAQPASPLQGFPLGDPASAAEEEGLRREVSEVWKMVRGRQKGPTVSRMQADVFRALRAALEPAGSKVAITSEAQVGLLSLDALVSVKAGGGGEELVGVEVDGPFHFFTNHPQVPLGSTRFKRRLLDNAVKTRQLRAWVTVPHWEWFAAYKGAYVDVAEWMAKLLLQRAGLEASTGSFVATPGVGGAGERRAVGGGAR